jgi:hypothetical protein
VIICRTTSYRSALGELPILTEHVGRISCDALEHLGGFSFELAREDLLARECPLEVSESMPSN